MRMYFRAVKAGKIKQTKRKSVHEFFRQNGAKIWEIRVKPSDDVHYRNVHCGIYHCACGSHHETVSDAGTILYSACQIWRLVSWILIPPSSLDIFTIIMLFFYYSIGTSLERAWGDFKYNVYIFSGILMTIIGSFLLYGIEYAVNGYPALMGTAFSTYYISLSIFLGFAISFPDMQVLLYFIIPIKIKWLAYLDVALLAYSMITSILSGNWAGCVVILCSLQTSWCFS